MFSKLMFVRNSEAMVRIVIDGLYPVAWLEAPDSQTGQGTNRDRITKVSWRCKLPGARVMLRGAALAAGIPAPALDHAAADPGRTSLPDLCGPVSALPNLAALSGLTPSRHWRRGHYLSPERLLQISKVVPKIAILTGDLDEIIDPQRSRDLERFLPVSLADQLALSSRYANSGLCVLQRAANTYSSREAASESDHRSTSRIYRI